MNAAVEAAAPERYRRLGPPPEDALRRLLPMRQTLGITRLADITGLDRVGLPVAQAVRPFSLSNAVSQGKGATLAKAAISAILESAECFFAERLAHFETTVAAAETMPEPRLFDQHLRLHEHEGWRAQQIRWVEAIDPLHDRPRLVPFELVHTAYIEPPHQGEGLFESSTTGLAAAFVEADAVLHGIMECVERDAIARAGRVHGFLQRFRINPATSGHPAVQDLLERLGEAGFLVGLWHAPSPTGLPVVWCHLLERAGQENCLLPFPADGSAASVDPDAAILHAIYEAAQSRLAAISGARDDITRANYPKHPDWQMVEAHRRLLAEGPRGISVDAMRPRGDLGRDALGSTLARLQNAGIDSVLRVRIDTAPVDGLAVVRILIPSLKPLREV